MKTNVIKIEHDHAKLLIDYKGVIHTVLIDMDDATKIEKAAYWRIKPSSHALYVCGWERGQTRHTKKFIYLHRFVTNCPPDMVVDHINHITLDNRKQNLRVCTQSENSKNKISSGQNKTGHRNIYFDSKTGTYRCEIKEKGKVIFKKSRVLLGEMLELRDEFIRNRYGSMENMLLSKTES